MKLSDKIEAIEESVTVQFTPLIQKLRNEGKEIIDFAVGEPDFETPLTVIESTKDAIDARKTRYGPVSGLYELKSKIARQFDKYSSDNIIISNGSKQSLYSIFQAILNPLDEVIIPTPYWVSFSQQITLAGGIPVFVNTRDHQLDLNEIEKAITKKTKAILINSPNNPTGAVYPKSDLEKIAELSLRYNLYIVSDEAYDFFVYGGLKHVTLFTFENIRDRVIITKSFSKSYSMTGFRVGYVAARKEIIRAITKLQSHVSGNVCTFVQYGALAALSVDESIILQRLNELERKRDAAYNYVSKLFNCIKPRGAFYLFPDVSSRLKKGETSKDFAAFLLKNAGVAVVPGEAFGMKNHIRISYAVDEKLLEKGFEKIFEVISR